ncbi:Uncharacterised protein [Segatella copri]|nr:Uncharacterised protein [Segatella copri]
MIRCCVKFLTMTADVIGCRCAVFFIDGNDRFLGASQSLAQSIHVPCLSSWRIDMKEMSGYLRVVLSGNNILFQLFGREIPVAVCCHNSEYTMICDCTIIQRWRIVFIRELYTFRFISLRYLGRYR